MAISKPPVLHDRYQLLKRLGSGGMGSVWLADALVLERQVALKELLRHDASDQHQLKERALREARALARVRHPAIVPIHDVFSANGEPWIVMEYIRGKSLAAMIKEHRLDERSAAAIGLAVLNGLRAAHRAGVVHRDVKPSTILVADDNSVFLVDFGIAKIAGDAAMTGDSRVLGTTEYIAPERLLGQGVTPASDLWSLGVTLFCALEGYSPFSRQGAHSPEATIAAVLRDDPPSMRAAGTLADLVPRLLRKEPARRPMSNAVAEILTSVLAPPSPTASAKPAGRRRPEQPTTLQLTRPYQAPPRPRVAPPPDPPRPRRYQELAVLTEADPDNGAAMLIRMPEEQAATVLAARPARSASKVLQVMAASKPDTVGRILQMTSSSWSGRALSYLRTESAASVLATMPAGGAARILNAAD